MHRMSIVCLLFSVAVLGGMTGDGCVVAPNADLDLRSPPSIIANSPIQPSLVRTLTVDLSDYADAKSLTWDFGDGAITSNMPVSSGRTINHEFTGPGTFHVQVHLFTSPDYINAKPATMIATGALPIEIIAPNVLPTAAFLVRDLFDDAGAVLPLNKEFNAQTSRDPDGSIVLFEWNFGDGATGTGRVLEHEFPSSGRFPVRLKVTDDRGGTSTITRTILANALPSATFTFATASVDGLTFEFDGSASSDLEGNIVSFVWDFGDETPEANGSIVTHTFAVPGDYTVVLTVTDDLGSTSSDSQLLDVTGTEIFVRSVSPDFGITGSTDVGIAIDGENFVNGATVRLQRGGEIINATTTTFGGASNLRSSFDLTGAGLGQWTVFVTNPDGATAFLENGFTVVSDNHVRITTSMGSFLMELVDDAPITTENFFRYVDERFYDGTIFHRVVPDFVVQGGGFLPGMVQPDGLHDPIVNEFSPDRSNIRETVAMAKVGGDPDSATSQFFVNLADNSANLDTQNGGFTVFARVVEGMDVVDAISEVPLNGSQPVDDVILISARRE